jgi:hypothetical protein
MRAVNAEEVFVKGVLRADIRFKADLAMVDSGFDDWIGVDPLAREQRSGWCHDLHWRLNVGEKARMG